ncbi:MAG: 2-hydroxyacid dehydrogenase [Pseudomonadota bacterium]
MARIIFPDCTPYMAGFYDAEMRALLPGLDLRVARPDPEELIRNLQGQDGVLHFQSKLTAPILAACPSLRVIVFLGTGVGSWVDLDAARRRGIAVRRVAGYGDRTVAEHAIALVFAAARKIAAMDRELRAGVWRADALYELEGKTLGVVGLGGCGREVARMGAALGFKVIGWNRGPVPHDLPCKSMELDAVLAKADIVSLHLGLNEETAGIIDRRRLSLLKPGAIFINTARGGLVDEAALVALLEDGRIAAGLDVFREEPLPAGHPLTRLANVTLSAHSAWMSPEAGRRLLRLGLETMCEEVAALG